MGKGKSIDAETAPVKHEAAFRSSGKPSSEAPLKDHPRLVYAPFQWGPGVRTEDSGVSVEDICASFADSGDVEAVAEQHGTTPDHVRDAVAYGRKVGILGG